MAQILNHNPEDNPRLNQIYETLLLAGYFRIRVASLKAFDKVIGGIAWCITSSNFEIQVDYNDEMQIGQKIKVAEQICNSLINMNCPYTLQPFQLQGLDVNNIFPVVQWLVKFVYETRFQRQKYNREISVLLGKDILKLQNKGNADKIPDVLEKRTRINRQIAQMKHNHPIRVYSALLEFNDATSLKMYHKLHNIITNKLEKQRETKKKTEKEKEKAKSDHPQTQAQQKQDEVMKYLTKEEEDTKENQPNLSNFGEVGKFSMQKLERIIEENKEKLEEAIKQSEEIENSASNEDKLLKASKMQNEKYEAQIKMLRNQLQSINNSEKQIEEEKNILLEKKSIVQASYQQAKANYLEIDEIGNEIEAELSQKNVKENVKVEKLVDKKMKLKQKKVEIKKKAKVKLEELQQQKIVAQASIPEIDEEALHHLVEEAEMKKEIYDKKYEELTKVNQELAILQRKAENFTSPTEIAQYHQRFIQLFESINCLIEEKRSIYNEMTNLESIKKLITNYQQFLSNAKDGVVNSKKKQEKKELADSLKEVLEGFQANSRNSKVTLEKLKSSRESSYAEFMDLIKLEREYLKTLRNFKVEYENAEKYYK